MVPERVKLSDVQLISSKRFPDWEATSDGSILCPSKVVKRLKAAYRENDRANYSYYPSSEDLRNDGIKEFRMHWSRGIKETAEEKMKGPNRIVKAVDCIVRTEINIELEDFVKGYFDGRVRENSEQQLLKLKDWPSPRASEEFLLYQRPDFISKIPLLEFVHSKWGLLNVVAELPHYSLQNDVGPTVQDIYFVWKGRGNWRR
ncbi:hypothetical protein CASFOL_031747 [Castilleja foliolosa]|uniref:Uncharacterized protein n=1 Tax=Castilleja foliolosa TaxID=1961234 RepID=A0ABD3C660_9LAMI